MVDRTRHMPRSAFRPWLLAGMAAFALATIGIVAEFGRITNRITVAYAPAQVQPAATPAKPPPAAVQPATNRPAFDVVRVGPQGDAVVAGRAEPDAEVVLRDGDRETGHATADSNGQFVMIPTDKLPAGSQELTLESRRPDGGVVDGDASVLLVIPDHTHTAPAGLQPSAPLAVLSPNSPAAAPRLLQAPDTTSDFGLDVLDYDEAGGVRFAGHAPAGATVRLYVDNRPIGDAVATQARAWALVPQIAIAPGQHHLRLDQIGPHGEVLARVELPMMREAPRNEPIAAGHLVVQPGASLWRLARDTYGQGLRYTVIYQANRDQIRNPDLIYPGQIFSLPPDAIAATPVSSSKSR
jgi:nucleoid-associated protein YgaU